MASSGTGVCGTTVFAASSIRPVTKNAMTSLCARRPRPSTSRPAASATVATAANSNPPTTEVAMPIASRTLESVFLARSSTRTSMGWNRPAPAAAEQTRKAAVESSRISLLSPFTPSQVSKAAMRKRRTLSPGAPGSAKSRPSTSQGCRTTANPTFDYEREQKAGQLKCWHARFAEGQLLQIALSYGVTQDAAVLATFQDTFCLPLKLPDPLARDVKLVAQLGEGGGLTVVETVAPDEHVARPLGETFDRLLQMLGLHLTHHGIRSIRDLVVLDKVTQLRGGLIAGDRLIQARRVRHGAHREAHLVGVPLQAPCDFVLCGLAFDLQGQLAHGPAHLPDLLRHVHGDADGAALIGHGTLHGLPYPPRGVGGEPEAPVGVELLDGLHQADVALLDEVFEGQPVAAVLLGHADDQPEVLLDEPLPGPPVAGLGPQAQIYLLGVREEIALADVREVLGEELGGLRFSFDFLVFLPLLEIGFQNALLTTHHLTGNQF